LVAAGITHVAMERTGEYWKPVYNILEGDFTVFLVNEAHAKQVPGRKTDQSDARWLAKRMRHGLVQASFIPPVAQRERIPMCRPCISAWPRAGVRNAPSWLWPTRSWSVPSTCFRATNPIMSEEPPMLTNAAGNISSTGSRSGLSGWGIV